MIAKDFFKNTSIFYINLENRLDRKKYISDHFLSLGIDDFERVSAYSPEDISENIISVGSNFGVTKYEIASSYSHLQAIKNFYENSNSQYGFFCEDDADLSNLKKINFSIEDLFNYFAINIDCFQLGISTREDILPRFDIRLRGLWDFNCSSYVITKEYAKKIIDYYFSDNNCLLQNFIPKSIIDYRNNSIISTTPVPEYIVYGLTNAITCPIFTYTIFDSSMNFAEENYRQNIKSRNDFYLHWGNFDIINIIDLIK